MGDPAILDARFTMSPGGLVPQKPDWMLPYANQDLCFIQGAGMLGQSRSHFTGMLNMEHGEIPAGGSNYPIDGWGGRYIGTFSNNYAVRGIGNGNLLPTVLRGGERTSPIADLTMLGFPGSSPTPRSMDREAAAANAYAN